MFFDQPATVSVCFGVRPKRGQSLRATLGAGDRMVLRAALGDVMQQHGDVERSRSSTPGISLLASGCSSSPCPDRSGQHIDAAQQMLVDRIVVIHVELHHRDDLAELRDEAAEHAGLVHPPQDQFGSRFEVSIDMNSRLASSFSRTAA
jgi:hypothetical protein